MFRTFYASSGVTALYTLWYPSPAPTSNNKHALAHPSNRVWFWQYPSSQSYHYSCEYRIAVAPYIEPPRPAPYKEYQGPPKSAQYGGYQYYYSWWYGNWIKYCLWSFRKISTVIVQLVRNKSICHSNGWLTHLIWKLCNIRIECCFSIISDGDCDS